MAKLILKVTTNATEAVKGISNLKKSIASLSTALSNVKVNKDLTAQLNSLAKYYNSVAEAGAKVAQQAKNSASNVETLRKGYANLITQLKTLQQQYPEKTFDETSVSIKSCYEQVKALSSAYQKNGNLTEEETKQLSNLSKQYKTLSANIAQAKAETEKLKTADPFSPKQGDSIFRLQKQYSSLVNSIQSIEKYYPQGTFDSIKTSAQTAAQELKILGQEYTTTGTLSEASQTKLNLFSDQLTQQQAAYESTKASAENYHGTLRDLVGGFLKFQLAASIVMNSIQLMRAAFNSLNEALVETEKNVVALQRVLDETISSKEISDSLYEIAERLGQTFENVQEIAQNFAKAGLSWQETLDATEAAVLALNVAELTATESSEGLIAVMQQFNYEASELTYVIDVLNKAADKSAVDTPALLVALQKTGSYAAAANLSLEQTVSLIAALSEATAASGQNIGNALKSLFSYTTRDSSLNTFASLSDDMSKVIEQYKMGAVSILDVWQQLSAEMQNLNSEQANLLENWSESSGIETELGGELSDIYDSLTGVYDSAGVYRKNYFIALMNNFDEVKEVMGEIEDAAGYTAEEQAKYMDTYEAKLNSLQAQWEHLANDEQGWLSFKKGLLDIANTLLTVIEYTGGLQTVVLGLGTALTFTFGPTIVNTITKALTSIKAGFLSTATAAQKLNAALGIIGIIATAISAVTGSINKAITEAKEKQEELQQKQEQAKNEAIAAANDEADAYKTSAQELVNYTQEIENYRKILESATASETDKISAQNELLNIQNALVESNKSYANSLDLINGEIAEQLDLVEKLSEKQLIEQAQKFLVENQTAINIAQSQVSGSSSTGIEELFSGNYFAKSDIEKKLQQIVASAGAGNASVSMDNLLPTLNQFTDVEDAFSEGDILGGIGELLQVGSIFNLFDEEYREGYSKGGIKVSGTIDEQIDALTKIKDAISKNESGLLSDTEIVTLASAIQEQIDALNSSEYQEAKILAERAKASQDLIDGTITYKEYLEIVYGIVQDTNDEIQDQIKNIQDLTDDALDALIEKLQEARDIEKESLDLEEKKLAVLEAQKALEDAKNQRGVYRLNAETRQFEWVQDEKAVADAEEDLNNAIEDLKDTVNDSIVSELESGNATNESILAILAGIASTIDNESMRGYLNSVLEIIRGQGIDIGNISYDSGGVANGMGYLAKATFAPESVNDPALTAKILSPTSNAQFDRYVRDMGIMFETARAYSQTPVLQSTIGNTTTTNNNSSITINGVKIGSDMMSRSFGEVLQMISIVPSK